MDDQVGSGGPAGQAHDEVVAQPERLVVPAVSKRPQSTSGEIRVLFSKQPGDQLHVDVDLCNGHLRHSGILPGGNRMTTIVA